MKNIILLVSFVCCITIAVIVLPTKSSSTDPDWVVHSLQTTAVSGEYALWGAHGSLFCPGSKTSGCFYSTPGGIYATKKIEVPYFISKIIVADIDPAENAIGLGAKTTLDTCGYWYEGYSERQGGEPGSGKRTKICFCTSDGAAEPNYAWKNTTGTFTTDAASIGTDTTCPDP
jgi:hypothetical protein